MFKILVVDDDSIEREGIIFLLKKVNTDAEYFEAPNGKEALKYIQSQNIDLIITDIKMPFMDGLELSKNVLKDNLSIKIILLSGYGEFEYAQKAIEIGVKSYLLKPIDPKQLYDAVNSQLHFINEERKTQIRNAKQTQYIKEYFIINLLNGIPFQSLYKKHSNILSHDCFETFTNVILLECNDELFSQISTSFFETISKKVTFDFTYYNLNPSQSIILLNCNHLNVNICVSQLYRAFYNVYSQNCYFAVSTTITEFKNLYSKFITLENLIQHKYFIPAQHIIYQKIFSNKNNIESNDDNQIIKKIKLDLKSNNSKLLHSDLGELFLKYYNRSNYSQTYVKFIFSDLLKEIYEYIPNDNNSPKELPSKIEQIYNAKELTDICNIIMDSLNKYKEHTGSDKLNPSKVIVDIKKYIYNNFNRNLSLNMLSTQFYLHPQYISFIFKKETGENINKFIKNIRMEKAKEYLQDTNIKINSICELVGYNNVSYFCQSFRHYFGISPEKYRQTGV